MLAFPCEIADETRAFDVHTLDGNAKFVPVGMMHGVLRFGICPRCGEPPEGTSARICTQSDCGLANSAGPRLIES